jgi:hypothetical protein
VVYFRWVSWHCVIGGREGRCDRPPVSTADARSRVPNPLPTAYKLWRVVFWHTERDNVSLVQVWWGWQLRSLQFFRWSLIVYSRVYSWVLVSRVFWISETLPRLMVEWISMNYCSTVLLCPWSRRTLARWRGYFPAIPLSAPPRPNQLLSPNIEVNRFKSNGNLSTSCLNVY